MPVLLGVDMGKYLEALNPCQVRSRLNKLMTALACIDSSPETIH